MTGVSSKDKVIKYMMRMRSPKSLKEIATATHKSEFTVHEAISELIARGRLNIDLRGAVFCGNGLAVSARQNMTLVYSFKKE